LKHGDSNVIIELSSSIRNEVYYEKI